MNVLFDSGFLKFLSKSHWGLVDFVWIVILFIFVYWLSVVFIASCLFDTSPKWIFDASSSNIQFNFLLFAISTKCYSIQLFRETCRKLSIKTSLEIKISKARSISEAARSLGFNLLYLSVFSLFFMITDSYDPEDSWLPYHPSIQKICRFFSIIILATYVLSIQIWTSDRYGFPEHVNHLTWLNSYKISVLQVYTNFKVILKYKIFYTYFFVLLVHKSKITIILLWSI